MPWLGIAWLVLGSVCAILIGTGIYVGFFGHRAEQRRGRLIHTITLFVYVTWILPVLLGIVSSALPLTAEQPALRAINFGLAALGFVVALYVSGRYRAYVFRIVLCSLGVLAGLIIGALIRRLVFEPTFLTMLLPLGLAVLLGWWGWRRGADVRAGWKIVSFSVAGAGLAGSGLSALIVAAIKGDPADQIGEMVLGAISTALKVAVTGVVFWEVALSAVLWALLAFSGVAAQCRAHARAVPADATLCTEFLRRVGLQRPPAAISPP
jgi:hypothetical protein